MSRTSKRSTIAFVILTSLIFLLIFRAVRITAIPWDLPYLTLGRELGPILGLIVQVLILVAILSVPIRLLVDSPKSISGSTPKKEWLVLLKKKETVGKILLGLVLAFMITISFSLVFVVQVSQAGTKIKAFIASNKDQNFPDYINDVSYFLNANVNNAYNRPEGAFKIDNEITSTLLDPYVMKSFGVSRADLIVYQGWGTCGQAAILIKELLHDAGYVTREAQFKNIDHQWAEVNYNGKWLIVDPWYIENFVEIQNLKNLTTEFQQASGVEVLYMNGTAIDASPEHGY